jgi:hypothetical protein
MSLKSPIPAGDSPTNAETADLRQVEVEYLCRRIFGVEPSSATIRRYAQFHEIYGTSLLAEKQVDVALLVDRNLDAEAIEFFLRTRQRKNTLTSKIWACAYFLEVQVVEDSASVPRLKPQKDNSAVTVILMLGWLSLRTAVKWVKGGIAVYRYNLA